MHFFDRFEKKFLFGLTRIFAMLVIFGILITIGISGIMFGGFHNGIDTKVTANEVLDSIKPPEIINPSSADSNSATQTTENTNILPSVKMPFILQKHFNTPENLHTLKNWLDVFPLDNHQEFINEMAEAVNEAEKIKLSTDDAINKYKELKFKKLEAEQSTKAERKTQQLYYAGAVISGMALIALFSLILVLLAIERNTRKEQQ